MRVCCVHGKAEEEGKGMCLCSASVTVVVVPAVRDMDAFSPDSFLAQQMALPLCPVLLPFIPTPFIPISPVSQLSSHTLEPTLSGQKFRLLAGVFA